MPHRTLRWRGNKPKARLPEAARAARYGLLAAAAMRAGYGHVLTAHTLDDQAETVMIKLLRGAWTEGLGGISPSEKPAIGGGCGKPSDGWCTFGMKAGERSLKRERIASSICLLA